MEWASSELVGLLYYLLPGFFTAWIFYGLTAHRKATPFERVVQALIFTAIIQVGVYLLQWTLLCLGKHIVAVGTWDKDVGFVASMFVAFCLGHALSVCANNNGYHRFLYGLPATLVKHCPQLGRLEITKRTSFPSEWFSALHADRRYVVLHLVDGRRLFGWPYELPVHPDGGHFVLMQPEWVLDENERAPLYNVERMLVPSGEVRYVDILKMNEEITATPEEEKAVEDRLIRHNRDIDLGLDATAGLLELACNDNKTGRSENGKQVSATATNA